MAVQPARTDESVRFNGRTNAPINCGCTVTTMIKAVSDDCAFGFHPSGGQFVLCDGSVRFITPKRLDHHLLQLERPSTKASRIGDFVNPLRDRRKASL